MLVSNPLLGVFLFGSLAQIYNYAALVGLLVAEAVRLELTHPFQGLLFSRQLPLCRFG
jgi:hypothetical protein